MNVSRDDLILSHLSRYHITTISTLERVTGASPTAVKRPLRRLEQKGLIQHAPLYGRRYYYHLSRAACRRLGVPEEYGEPLGAQALATRFGVLEFCTTMQIREKGNQDSNALESPSNHWELFTRREFMRKYPQLPLPRSMPNFYPDMDKETERLGRIYVDLGGSYQRLMRELIRKTRDMREHPGWLKILDSSGFVFAIVVADQSKRNAIAQALGRKKLTTKIRAFILPELAFLIYGG